MLAGLDSTRGGSRAIRGRRDAPGPLPSPVRRHGDARVVVDAKTDLTWQAVLRGDLSRSAVIQALLELRSLPNRLQRVLKRQPPGPARPPLTLQDMERAGFLLLGESPGHEIVFGAVVQPWKAVTDDEPAPPVEPGRFAAFDTPGYVKVAFNIRVEPYGSGRALITTETRTAATDPASLRRFARYWILVGPFSALIRRLSAADRQIRCRATTWPYVIRPGASRTSVGEPSGARRSIRSGDMGGTPPA